MKNLQEDTIAALATPQGNGAISVIRLSGPLSFAAIDSVFDGKVKISEAKSHTIHYGKIIDDDEIIDDVLISVFRKPKSYTGEDSVEISIHGNQLIAKKIIELLIKHNVRPAEPGEFTKRAYLNSRIDLTQAEAVADVIHSRTEASLRGARNQLDGHLSNKVKEIRERLVNLSSFLELELDFAEEDIELVKIDEMVDNITKVRSEIEDLINSYSFGRVIRDGVNVALVGIPNVGKSSILNYILKESRAIVSEIPGTTRDIIREEVSIDGILFKLFDTAGIRISSDEIEKEGVQRSREAIENADVILLIGDTELGFSDELMKEVNQLNPQRAVRVLNKIDLNPNSNILADLKISAKTGDGMKQLLYKVKEEALGGANYTERDAVVSNVRHYDCLKRANENLEKALESANGKLSGEFIAADLRAAENALSEIIGEITPDDILNNIFSNFCIGK